MTDSAATRVARRFPRHLAVSLVLIAIFVLARAIWIDVDPPSFLLGKRFQLRELVVEPIAKASEARNFALFGKWTPNAADEYQFWRPQSPFWVYPLAGFLKLFGVGLVELRAFAILYTLVGFALLLAIARQKLRGIEFVAVGVFVALDALYVTYSRSGMLEPAVNTWAALVVLCLLLARRHYAYQLGAHWAFIVAFFTKGAALYLLPLLAVTSLWLLVRSPSAERKWKARAIVLGHGLLLAGAALLYVRSDFYMRTLIWNFNHMVLDQNQERDLLVSAFSLKETLSSLFDTEKLETYAALIPVTGPVALLEVILVGVSLVRRKPVDAYRVIVSGWLLSALVTLLFVKSVDLRYGTILPLPAAVLAGCALHSLAEFIPNGKKALRLALPVTALAVFAGVNGYLFRELYAQRNRQVLEGSRVLVETLGRERATIIGYSSAPVVFSTPYEHYYVKKPFNVSRAAIDRLGVTHLLLSRDRTTRDETRIILDKRYPGILKNIEPLTRFRVFTAELTLYAVPGSLAAASAEASR